MRLQIFLLIKQNADVVQTCGPVAWCERQNGLELLFCILELVALVLDSGEQPQGLNMIAAVEQIRPKEVVCRRQFAVREQASGPHNLGWKLFQDGDLLGG